MCAVLDGIGVEPLMLPDAEVRLDRRPALSLPAAELMPLRSGGTADLRHQLPDSPFLTARAVVAVVTACLSSFQTLISKERSNHV